MPQQEKDYSCNDFGKNNQWEQLVIFSKYSGK